MQISFSHPFSWETAYLLSLHPIMSYPDSLREVIKHIAFLAGPFGRHIGYMYMAICIGYMYRLYVIACIFLGTWTATKSVVKMSLFFRIKFGADCWFHQRWPGRLSERVVPQLNPCAMRYFNSIICSLEKTNKLLSHRDDLEMSRFSSSHLISGYF